MRFAGLVSTGVKALTPKGLQGEDKTGLSGQQSVLGVWGNTVKDLEWAELRESWRFVGVHALACAERHAKA
jgi:hypothetical protein